MKRKTVILLAVAVSMLAAACSTQRTACKASKEYKVWYCGYNISASYKARPMFNF